MKTFAYEYTNMMEGTLSVHRLAALLWIAVLRLSFSCTFAASDRRIDKRYNILLLITDDQDVELGSFDTMQYMPQLHKKLREQGVTFEHGALVHTPICCPSRSTLLTGRYLHTIPLAINNSVSGNCYGKEWKDRVEPYHTFAVHAQQAGYTTLYAGKYLNRYQRNVTHLSSSVPPGWDYWLGLEGNSRYYNYTLVEGRPDQSEPILHRHGDQYPIDYLPLVLRNYTLDMIQNTLPEPWLAVVAWPTPHGPFTPEPKYRKWYSDAQAPRSRPNYNASTSSQQGKHWIMRQLGFITNSTAQQVDNIYRNRLRALKTVDNHVGDLMRVLEQSTSNPSAKGKTSGNTDEIKDTASTLASRTVVLFTSDNGYQFGQHRLSMDKRHLYEHDIRVPLVVRGPQIPRNVTVPRNVLASLIDIAPTLLDIMTMNDTPKDDSNQNGTWNSRKSRRDESSYSSATKTMSARLREARERMNGLSFWSFLNNYQAHDMTSCDPFTQRTDVLISYHGEGNPQCGGMSECPTPFDNLWDMPDSFNNTYHCVRTLRSTTKPDHEKLTNDRNDHSSTPLREVALEEDSVFCVFHDDEEFVEFFDLIRNPHQLGNDFHCLNKFQFKNTESASRSSFHRCD